MGRGGGGCDKRSRNTSMVVTHVITGLNCGGAEAVLTRLCASDTFGNRHEVISLMDDGYFGAHLRQGGALVHTLGLQRGHISLSAFGKLVSLLRELQPDVVQTWMYHGSLVGGIAAKLAGNPNVVWGIHHTNLDPRRDKFSTRCVVRCMARLSRRLARATICCAAKSKAAHIELGFSVEGMRVVRNGYDLEQFAPQKVSFDFKRNMNFPADVPIVGMVARYHAQKDHGNLLEALRILLSKGRKCRLVLVGTGLDNGNAELLRSISRNGLGDHVTLLGPSDNVPHLMNVLDLHILSSAFGEAFPNVLAEAMACGTPCVTTDVGDAADIVGDTGWVVPPKDPIALASAIDSALSEWNTDKWQTRCETARKRIEENFSMKRMVEGYNSVWLEVVEDYKLRAKRLSSPVGQSARDRREQSHCRSYESPNFRPLKNATSSTDYASTPASQGEPLRVLHIITGLDDGGAEGILYLLCTADRDSKHIAVVSLMDEGKYGPMLRAAGIPVEPLGMKRGALSATALFSLVRVLRRYSPDVVQTWMYHADLLGGLVARSVVGCPVVWGIRNGTLSWSGSKFTTLLARGLLGGLSWTVPQRIVVCAQEALRVHRAIGYNSQKMVVVPNGFDVTAYRPCDKMRKEFRASVGASEDDLLLGMVGRFDPQKDHRNLLHALKLLSEKVTRVRCVLVGNGIDLENPEFKTLHHRWMSRVPTVCLGSRSDIACVMNGLDLHVLPSAFGEAFPNVLVEAMACETPCITTDVGDATEIVGKTGWVVPARNPEALAGAIHDALEESRSPAWKSRCIAARRRVEESYGLQKMVSAYNQVWNEAVNEK